MCLHSFGFPKERKDIFVTLTSGRRSQVFLVDSTDCIEMFNETSVRSIGKPFRMDLEKSSTVPSISLQRNPRLRYTRPKNTNFNRILGRHYIAQERHQKRWRLCVWHNLCDQPSQAQFRSGHSRHTPDSHGRDIIRYADRRHLRHALGSHL